MVSVDAVHAIHALAPVIAGAGTIEIPGEGIGVASQQAMATHSTIPLLAPVAMAVFVGESKDDGSFTGARSGEFLFTGLPFGRIPPISAGIRGTRASSLFLSRRNIQNYPYFSVQDWVLQGDVGHPRRSRRITWGRFLLRLLNITRKILQSGLAAFKGRLKSPRRGPGGSCASTSPIARTLILALRIRVTV